jgi:uncharacterized Zn-binding protein involved in type VI secretion
MEIRMPAAARLGDNCQVQQDAHGCPACPHPGIGPIVVGSPNVNINSLPAGRVDDLGVHGVCCGPNFYKITKGSPTVYVNGKPLARLNDKTKHCGGDGKVVAGSPDVMIDDGASAEGLGSYVINALKILLEQALANQAGTAQKASDSNTGTSKGKGESDLAQDGKEEQGAGSIVRAGFAVARALNGQEVELQIECKDPKGSLKIEIWATSSDRTQDKVVHKVDASAAASVKQKVKLDIPSDAAGGNECHFYFVVKDDKGGEVKSPPIFVDRTPFKFSS